jgi:hypothetical protein
METKSIITIDNMREQKASIEVKDFSEKEVKKAIKKLTGITVKDLKLIVSNHYHSLYKVTKKYADIEKTEMFYLPEAHESYIKRNSKSLHFKVFHGQLYK